MKISLGASLLLIALLMSSVCHAAPTPELPAWRVLVFEEKAFWATAQSRIEVSRSATDESLWELAAYSSVGDNAEWVTLRFNPNTGLLRRRERLSQGSKEQRYKTFEFGPDSILRKRHNPGLDPKLPPEQWPVTLRRPLQYPETIRRKLMTDPYLLLLLAGRLQAKGPGSTQNIFVNTDVNFFRVHMVCVKGVPLEPSYKSIGGKNIRGTRETLAVVLQFEPEGKLAEKSDFSLLGMEDNIIILFDKITGVPIQVRGDAPRIGPTQINLKSVTMRARQS